MLQQAGLSEGMRVLDVGNGSGDVAVLVASLVGPMGEVVGMDKSQQAVDMAQQRVKKAGLINVNFVTGNANEACFATQFDAAVGRLVLMHQPDPAARLRSLSRCVRTGGVIAFQEFDISAARSSPPSPTFEQGLKWISEAFAAAGTDIRMGVKLCSTFVNAGLPPPNMSLEAGIWGGEDNAAATLLSDVIRSLLPVIEKFGIATAEKVEIDTLRERIQSEISAGGGVAISPSLIGAWTRLN
jgi:SAM-dependent methyltransferase